MFALYSWGQGVITTNELLMMAFQVITLVTVVPLAVVDLYLIWCAI